MGARRKAAIVFSFKLLDCLWLDKKANTKNVIKNARYCFKKTSVNSNMAGIYSLDKYKASPSVKKTKINSSYQFYKAKSC